MSSVPPSVPSEDLSKINQESEPLTLKKEESQIGEGRTTSGVAYTAYRNWKKASNFENVFTRQRSGVSSEQEPESPISTSKASTSSLQQRKVSVSSSSSSTSNTASVKKAISAVFSEEDPLSHQRTFNRIYKELEGIEDFSERDTKIKQLFFALVNYEEGIKKDHGTPLPSELKGIIDEMQQQFQKMKDNIELRREAPNFLKSIIQDQELVESLIPVLSKSYNKNALEEFKAFYEVYENAKYDAKNITKDHLERVIELFRKDYPKDPSDEYKTILDSMIKEVLQDYPKIFIEIDELFKNFGKALKPDKSFSTTELKAFESLSKREEFIGFVADRKRVFGLVDLAKENSLHIDLEIKEWSEADLRQISGGNELAYSVLLAIYAASRVPERTAFLLCYVQKELLGENIYLTKDQMDKLEKIFSENISEYENFIQKCVDARKENISGLQQGKILSPQNRHNFELFIAFHSLPEEPLINDIMERAFPFFMSSISQTLPLAIVPKSKWELALSSANVGPRLLRYALGEQAKTSFGYIRSLHDAKILRRKNDPAVNSLLDDLYKPKFLGSGIIFEKNSWKERVKDIFVLEVNYAVPGKEKVSFTARLDLSSAKLDRKILPQILNEISEYLINSKDPSSIPTGTMRIVNSFRNEVLEKFQKALFMVGHPEIGFEGIDRKSLVGK